MEYNGKLLIEIDKKVTIISEKLEQLVKNNEVVWNRVKDLASEVNLVNQKVAIFEDRINQSEKNRKHITTTAGVVAGSISAIVMLLQLVAFVFLNR